MNKAFEHPNEAGREIPITFELVASKRFAALRYVSVSIISCFMCQPNWSWLTRSHRIVQFALHLLPSHGFAGICCNFGSRRWKEDMLIRGNLGCECAQLFVVIARCNAMMQWQHNKLSWTQLLAMCILRHHYLCCRHGRIALEVDAMSSKRSKRRKEAKSKEALGTCCGG